MTFRFFTVISLPCKVNNCALMRVFTKQRLTMKTRKYTITCQAQCSIVIYVILFVIRDDKCRLVRDKYGLSLQMMNNIDWDTVCGHHLSTFGKPRVSQICIRHTMDLVQWCTRSAMMTCLAERYERAESCALSFSFYRFIVNLTRIEMLHMFIQMSFIGVSKTWRRMSEGKLKDNSECIRATTSTVYY
jgi:hypothetical protein